MTLAGHSCVASRNRKTAVIRATYSTDEQDIRGLLDGSQNHQAFELAQHLLREHGGVNADTARIAHLAALAAARAGALKVAQSLTASLLALAMDDVAFQADLESLAGRLAKDEFIGARDDAARHSAAHRSIEAYQRADTLKPNVYARINAATMSAMIGDEKTALAQAGSVLAEIGESADADHWTHATLGEAQLLLGDEPGARRHYQRAGELAGQRYGDIASMRRQLRLLQPVRPAAASLLDVVRGPNVVAFSGHMIDAPTRAAPRFPAHIEAAAATQIGREVDALLPVVAYTQAANGSDILFCEALLARGQEVNIVLPFERADYVAQSVAPGGIEWVARFDAVLANANSITYATEGLYLGDDTLFEHASDLIQGLASLRAQALAVEPTMLVVADPSQAGAAGGTLATLAGWTARSHRHRVIDLKPLRDAAVAGESAPAGRHAAARPEPLAGGRHIRSLLFADVKGFSKLREEHAPGFFTSFLGLVPQVLKAHDIEPLEMSSRGDGLYMVFGSAEDASRFAWELSIGIGVVDWAAMGLPADTHIRIALHAGPVFIAVDPVNRWLAHYGAHVTRAARIEPIVVPGQILVTEPFAAVLAAQSASKFTCDLVGVEPLAKDYGTSRLYRLRES